MRTGGQADGAADGRTGWWTAGLPDWQTGGRTGGRADGLADWRTGGRVDGGGRADDGFPKVKLLI